MQLVRYACDRGIRYFDTAGLSYMESQTILGEALQDRRRQVCLVTKVDTSAPGEVRKSVDRSLRELKTDYLDILLIHGTPGLQLTTASTASCSSRNQVPNALRLRRSILCLVSRSPKGTNSLL
jgi:aryl-alcohol dehydrogenase-like predicted oxidoreductase